MSISFKLISRAFVALGWVVATGLAQADCSAPADAGACPRKVNGNVVFDRCFGSFNGQPTDVGNQVCGALRNTHKLLDQVGDNNQRALRQAEADWRAFQKVALEGAIDKEAINDIRNALSVGKEIEAEVNGLLKDQQCGTKGALDALQRRFDETGKLLVGGAQVAGLTLDAVGKLRPVVDEAAKIVVELQRLADSVNKKGAKAKTEYDALNRAIADLQKELQGLLAADLAGAASAGTGLLTGVGPFVGESTACATALGTSVASLAGGGTVTAGGAAVCPESAGISCALAAVGLPVGGVAATAVDALGSVPCVAALGSMDKMGQYVGDINKFVEGLVKLANALPRSATQAVTAGQALGRLSAELGTEGQASLRAIQASLNAMQPAFDAAGGVLENSIAPKVQRLAGNFVQGLAQDTRLLSTCYHKLNRAMAHMGSDLGEAAVLLAQASTELVDAGKVAGNLAEQGQDGLRAANKAAGDEWADLSHDFRVVHRRVWAVNPGEVDLPKTGTHLVALVTNPNEVRDIIGDSARLVERTAELPAKALNAGKRAFLDQDRLTIAAKAKYNAGQTKARRAVVELKKVQIQAKAKIDKAPRVVTVNVPSALPAWPTAQRPRLATLSVVK
jgi:hypothetical protein